MKVAKWTALEDLVTTIRVNSYGGSVRHRSGLRECRV